MAELQGAISAILLEADGAKGKGGSEGGKMRPPPPQTSAIVHFRSSPNFLKLQISLFVFTTMKLRREQKSKTWQFTFSS